MTSYFNIQKYNARTNDERLAKRGVTHKGINGSFWLDVIFTANQPGFVLQHVTKYFTSLSNTCLPNKEREPKEYWEIFYIDKNAESVDADGFVQRNCGKKSSGRVTFIGVSEFYPYSNPVKFDKEGNMEITPILKKIFGRHVYISKNSEANGLPYSLQKPFMTGLTPYKTKIYRKVECQWKPGRTVVVKESVQKDNLLINLDRPKEYLDEFSETNLL